MTAARLLPAVAAAALVLVVAAGCGDDPAPGSAAVPSAAPVADAAEATVPPSATDQVDALPEAGSTIDACTLITDDEATEVLGSHGGAQPELAVGVESVCGWTNPETFISITLRLGLPGSAPSGRLPDESPLGPTEPGPDGIRFTRLNIAEFALGDRACDIQVVTSIADDSDRPTAVRLIGLVRARA